MYLYKIPARGPGAAANGKSCFAPKTPIQGQLDVQGPPKPPFQGQLDVQGPPKPPFQSQLDVQGASKPPFQSQLDVQGARNRHSRANFHLTFRAKR